MNRLDFMSRLEMLLSDLSEGERIEALQYYNDYFNDAGVENEQDVIESLGSPEKVASIIREGLNDGDRSQGEFNENGFSGYGAKEQAEVERFHNQEKTEQKNGKYHSQKAQQDGSQNSWNGEKKKRNTGNIILIIILCIFALPIFAPLFFSFLAVLASLVVAAAALLGGLILVGIALIVTGVILFILGFIKMFVSPFAGLCIAGAGLIGAGIGILISISAAWLIIKIVPMLIRGIVKLCRMPFERKRG